MNDFTKTDLIDIGLCVADYKSTAINNFGDCLYPELLSKIQSLIDNYCEHEFKCSNEAHFKCKDCGVRER